MSSFLTAVAAPTSRSAPIPITAGGASAASVSGAPVASGSSSYSDHTEGIISARSSVAEFELPGVVGEDTCNDQVGHAQLGYKDELEVRFIWDRVLGKGRHGTSTRVVIDRFTGQEYACKKMPKQVPRDLLPEKASLEEIADADAQQVDHIRREITLFTKLRSSLNVAKLEQVYEDSKNVYLVMEKCDGPTLAEVAESGPVNEADVSTYMRSVVRTVVQCHDENEVHAGVEPSKFMLLTEDRQSTVKATGFGRHGGIFRKLSSMAPEMFSKMPAGVGKNADTWAAGLMATRLLTEYFPFDDVLSNVVDCTGVLAPLAPVTSVLDENPLMPSGAALFVSAMVMLLDFSRPKWQPITAQAKDFVVNCLDMDAKRRWSPAAALEHPWLQRLKPRGAKGGVRSGVVQRIQRFGSFNEFKRAALEQIAHRCLTQSMGLRSGAKPAAAQPPQEVVTARDALTDGTDVPMSDAHAAASAPPSAHIADADDTPADAAAPLPHSSRSPTNARAHSGGNDSMSTEVASASAEGAHAVQGAVGDAVCLEKAQGLLQHMMVTGGGTIDRFTLADGLAKLGYVLPESDLEHLLAQLSAVPGLTTATAVTSASLAASQLDAATSPAEWREMARAAFDALDLDGDGKVHRDEMAALLAGRCPKDEVDEAVAQAIADAGLPPTADSLDQEAFLRLLQTDMSPTTPHPLTKFPSMAQSDPWAVPSFSGMLKRACSTTLRRRSHVSSVAGGDPAVAPAPGADAAPADAVPLKDAVCGALNEEVRGCAAMASQSRRVHGGNACVPCMDASIAHAALQPVGMPVVGPPVAGGMARGGASGGGGQDNRAPPLEMGGGGAGGRGGNRRMIAGGNPWEGDDDDFLSRNGWDRSRLSEDRVRSMFLFPSGIAAGNLDPVAEVGAHANAAEDEWSGILRGASTASKGSMSRAASMQFA